MLIIGLQNDEDSGVSLLRDGRLVDCVNEERFNRTKLYQGFPHLGLSYVLKKNGLTLDDIDYFAYGWHGRQNDYGDFVKRLTGRIIEAMRNDPDCWPIIKQRVETEFDRDGDTRKLFEKQAGELGIPSNKIIYLDHHECHASSAYMCSPFEKAMVFTFDGRGDLKSTTVSIADDKGMNELDYCLSFDSLGFLYGQITHFLGFKPHRHEGKITGLAAYGDPEKTRSLFRDLIQFKDGRFVANIGLYKPFYTNLTETLKERLEHYSREDLAAGVQKHCEELVRDYIRYWREKVPPEYRSHICLAGGIAANVRINQVVAEIPGVDNIFVFPHMGDGGLGAGAALRAHRQATGKSKVKFETVYLGPDYSENEILTCLKSNASSLTYEKTSNKVESVIEALLEGKVVGYFDGRMEFGPRALGARSVLFHTRDRSSNDWLNKRLCRTEFMPFAPVTPIELAEKCYVGWRSDHISARFMTRTYDCTDDFKDIHPAVVHIDGTARPQIVSEELNGDYYKIVAGYCEKSGEMALINTSFNQHEEPIVCTPEDAVSSLLRNNIDILFIGPYKITKK